MGIAWIALAAYGLAGGQAPAQDAPVVAAPDWERAPAADELAPLYPAAARAKGLGGETMMKCRVTRDGTLTDCTIVEESPPDMGFGAATLAAARYFKMKPTTPDGTPADGGTVYIPLKWRLG